MKKLGSILLGAFLLGIVVVAVSLLTSAPAPAAPTVPPIPVAVVNTPLPVNASISGIPTVNVSGLPAVQLSGTPTVNLSTSSSNPLYVDADRSARNSFSASCDTSNYDPTAGQASCTIFTIPAGRQVVIESVACTAEVAAGQGIGQADLIVPNIPFGAGAGSGAVPNYVPLAMTRQTLNTSGSGVDIWALSNQLKLYGAAPSYGSVDIGVYFRASFPNLNPPQGMNCVINGYMVP